MAKKSNQYLDVAPFKIIETGFHKERAMVSESIFSLGNEYCGIRGFFEEGYGGKSLQGSYFNGVYEYALKETENAYRGIVKRTHFTINSVNWIKCRIKVSNEVLDLDTSKIESFVRELDMQNGLLKRSFLWHTPLGDLWICFERFLNMENCHEAIQRITFSSDIEIPVQFSMHLDSNVVHWGKDCYWRRGKEILEDEVAGVFVSTLSTKQSLLSLMYIDSLEKPAERYTLDKEAVVSYNFVVKKKSVFTRYVINLCDKNEQCSYDFLLEQAHQELKSLISKGYEASLKQNFLYFQRVWETSDVEIFGDAKNQQGIRYCIFQLEQTYHGYAKDNNIGAKGLTGEAYSGHAFWDSETYCLPFYLFTNQEAAKNLLMFRYNTLEQAKRRAQDLDCVGACFPIATRNGKEGCNLWQHASLQFQPSTGVVYAIRHYMYLYEDQEFMKDYGLEMIVEVCKFLLSRGQYNADQTGFGYFGVMGPDEFQMMVNQNTYTNFMAKKSFDYLLEIVEKKEYQVDSILNKCKCPNDFLEQIKEASHKMIILYEEETKLFEQHEGFYKLPHIDVNQIPTSDFPLYSHWTYDRIYRNDMIKQPDVLMFMFLWNQDFTLEQKRKNYEFYEPKCIHESSLSPSIHSIFACELGKLEEAEKFFEFATRLDLDDYNCNTCEGIHMTSIAAAWMNIVYGFGGLRSERKLLKLAPMILPSWEGYSFKIKYHGSKLKITVTQQTVKITLIGNPIELMLYDKLIVLKKDIEIERPKLCLN